jgi:hypothetical protein
MGYLGGRLLRQRFEGTERRVPVAVAVKACYLVPFGAYAADLGLDPTQAVEEAIGLWIRREEQRRARRVRARVAVLMRRAEQWDPIGDLIGLADWQRAFSSDGSPWPIDGLCRLIEQSRGKAIGVSELAGVELPDEPADAVL